MCVCVCLCVCVYVCASIIKDSIFLYEKTMFLIILFFLPVLQN